ncbi:hypothetical protein D3C71_1098770 [compost metagenome]
MPGAYAHITAVNWAKSRARDGLSKESLYALGKRFAFAELGCVSPDYPYLGPGQAFWADQMHYKNTANLLRSGVAGVKSLNGVAREKATSWLLGLACHMTADMTIHPIVEKIVGPYELNKGAHRLCEMHQDTFIFSQLNLGDVGLTNHLATGIGSCSTPRNSLALDPSIKALWLQMLAASYSGTDQGDAPEPRPDLWHAGFCTVLKAVGTATALFPFARHVAADNGLVYPALQEVSKTYVKALSTPEGVMDYGQVFDRAVENIIQVWTGIDKALSGSYTYLNALEDWNLDTGRSQATGKYVFWRN